MNVMRGLILVGVIYSNLFSGYSMKLLEILPKMTVDKGVSIYKQKAELGWIEVVVESLLGFQPNSY